MKMYEVSSEIYTETDFKPTKTDNGRIISKFQFIQPSEVTNTKTTTDNDGDLVVHRKKEKILEIEHSGSTVLKLVGLQVWRGALLIADFLFHNRLDIAEKEILELGAGVGLSSIAGGIYAKKVFCTDVNLGGILDLIQSNVNKNKSILRNDISVFELDFLQKQFTEEVENVVKGIDIVIAADVIYDDDLTEGLISVLDKLLDKKYTKPKTIYIALEKRYVFTINDLDTSAPCYDYFLKNVSNKPWIIENIPIDFPQYFKYERCKELVLIKITNR